MPVLTSVIGGGSSRGVVRDAGLAMACGVVWSSVALAQVGGGGTGSKPSATPIDSGIGLEKPDIEAFARAYERDDRPTMLVLVGWTSGDHQASDPARVLFNADPSGVTQQIKSAIEEVLNDPAVEAELVNINALRASSDRLGTVLESRGERDAVVLLSEDLSAQLVLIVRLHTIDRDGGIGKATVEAFRADRARTLFTIAFDWKGGTSARDLKINGRQIARAFINDYSKRLASDRRRLTLRLLGMSDTRVIRDAREALEGVIGVENVRRRTSGATRRDGVTQFEITYTGSDPTTLADDAALALEELLGRLEAVKDEGGSYTLRPARGLATRGFTVADDERCVEDLIDVSAAGDVARAELRAAAVARGNPRIAVFINREAPFDTAPVATDAAQAPNTMIVIGAGGRDSAAIGVGGSGGAGGAGATDLESRRREAALQARVIEDALSDRLGNGLLGLRVIDGDTARQRVAAEAQTPVSEAQLAALLRSRDVADIVVIGSARVRPEGSAVPAAAYTFRAIDTRTGEVLGSYAAGATLPLVADAAIVDVVARRAAGALGCRMLRAWATAGATEGATEAVPAKAPEGEMVPIPPWPPAGGGAGGGGAGGGSATPAGQPAGEVAPAAAPTAAPAAAP